MIIVCALPVNGCSQDYMLVRDGFECARLVFTQRVEIAASWRKVPLDGWETPETVNKARITMINTYLIIYLYLSTYHWSNAPQSGCNNGQR